MLKRIIFFVSLFVSGVCVATTLPDTHEFEFSNGLKLIVREDHRAPVVISQVWYKVGSSYESLGTTGISHMLEHMMFKGTEQFPKDILMENIAGVGGQHNAFTARDFTAYFQKLPASQLELSFQIESNRMQDLLFDNNEFLKERDVVAEERRLRTENVPSSQLREMFIATSLPASPYHHPVIGWMQDIQSYKLEDIKDWYERYYAPNNAILVVVGDVNPNQVYDLAKKYFADIQPKVIPEHKTMTYLQNAGKKTLELELDSKVPELLLGYNAPSFASSKVDWEPYALELIQEILTHGRASRFQQELVRNKKIAANINSDYDTQAIHDSLFIFRGWPTENATLKALEQAILSQLDKLKQTKVSKIELDRARQNVIARDIYSRDSIFNQALVLGAYESIGKTWRDADAYVTKIQAITAEQIRDVAKKYFNSQSLTTAYLLPKKTKG